MSVRAYRSNCGPLMRYITIDGKDLFNSKLVIRLIELNYDILVCKCGGTAYGRIKWSGELDYILDEDKNVGHVELI